MPDNDESAYADLASFLSSDRPDLRAAAAEAAASVSASASTSTASSSDDASSSSAAQAAAPTEASESSPSSQLVRAGAVPPLCKLASHPGQTGLDALAALLNLSSGDGPSARRCVDEMTECGAASRLTEIALCSPPPKSKGEDAAEKWRRRTNLCLALLANLTRTERGAVVFCGRSMPDEAVYSSDAKEEGGEDANANVRREAKPAMTLLLGRFLLPLLIRETEDSWKGSPEDIGGRSDDPFQHFASVLMNATQVEQGRRFVLRLSASSGTSKNGAPSSSVLQLLLPSLRHPNPVRRRGVAGTLKNCAFDKDSAWWLLNEVDLTKHILYPLAGPEELDVDERSGLDPELWLEGPDKVREPVRDVRLLLVETLLLLCATGRRSREVLRAKRTYVILKTMDLAEDDGDVSSRVDECVQFLRRDEKGTEEGSSDMRAEAAYKGAGGAEGGKGKELLALPAPRESEEGACGGEAGDVVQDFDGVD
mmetsp:Transcript_31592/g.94521  ORF Transcript_31592/g.94521 Transcript_31592/m.94521 type:complete len:481 (-) Transcript_31592:196-1638(-)|eukprot:CAMPEP_0113564246 /NCGR_PEP_ID=MMETSP0015_2-20120614/21515_1 /TAXON_ID=2838 /ORGANISM="Odontella" /LENGTH=480 /DNA_ID=CAMNT_0000466311 /DNA_START=64 /DNA_END=1506 /DNA_ORIENTATION=+ /assembly_acc=CAM_ASM_000160